MRACVFLGPSLGRDAPASTPDLAILPPAARGDLYRAATAGARIVGLIDGYFDGVPAVAHKEILWAIDSGVRVLGAASMGALRAAELAPYGMEGVGEIYAAFAGGLEGDDEVAVLHGPAETGWMALSEAMVDVRATLAAATGAGVLDPAAAEAVASAAKALFYKERRWPAILGAAEADAAALRRFEAWLPQGRVERKRADALLLLERVRALLAAETRPEPPSFAFETTQAFAELVAEAEAPGDPTLPPDLATLLLGELRLQPELYRPLRDRALARLLAARERPAVEPARVRAELERLRLAAGLLRRADLDAWLAARGVDSAWLEEQARNRAALAALADAERARLDALLLDELRLAGDYPDRLRRAEARPGC